MMTTLSSPSLSSWDYVVLGVILLISTFIGVYYRYTGGKQRTTKEYLMADGSMSAFPVSFSLMASFMSAISLMGVSKESYGFGIMFCVINISYVLGTPVVAYLFLPVFYRMQNTSVYEYLERRFGHTTRFCVSIAFSLQMIVYMGIVLYAPAMALEAVTGLNQVYAILIIGLVCTFYSTIGGLKAVLITDVFQSLLMFAAIYCVIIVSAMHAGGLGAIWETASERGRLSILSFSLDPTVRHTWWSLICGGFVTYLSIYGVNQTQVQRLLSVRNLKSSQLALWWNLPILGLLSCSTLFSGLAIFSYYRDCDPVQQGRIESRDQLMPLFAIDTMAQYPGLCGLFMSGIFSASLSTISSAVSSLAAVTLEDYVKPLFKYYFKRPIANSSTTTLSKIMAFIYGLVCIGLAFFASSLGGVLQASLTLFGVIGGPLLAVFTLGTFTTRANQRGVLFALLLGLTFSVWIGFGGPKPKPLPLEFSTAGCPAANETIFYATESTEVADSPIPPTEATPSHYFWLYRLSYMWLSVIGFGVTLVCGYLFSWLFERVGWANNAIIYIDLAKKQLDYDLFVPPLSRRLQAKAVEDQLDKLNQCDTAM